MTPTPPTPRAVCGKRVTRSNGDWLPCTLPEGHPVFRDTGCAVIWGGNPEPTWNPRDIERRKNGERRAALAASAGLLSAEWIAKLRHAMPFVEPEDAGNEFMKVLTAYTALAAECARLTAEVLDFRGHESEGPRHCGDCGRRMVWTSARGESWVCPYHVWRRMENSESDLAALRATVALFAEARRAYSTGGIDGARSELKRAFDAMPLARTPTPEGQG